MSTKKHSHFLGLEQALEESQTSTLRKIHNGRSLYEAYNQIKLNLKGIQESVVLGAMVAGINDYIANLHQLVSDLKNPKSKEKIADLMFLDPVVFLNDHGPDHVEKVIERAGDIVRKLNKELSDFEFFLLLCSIQIHDIGNILGRSHHEKKLDDIFDEISKNIILDSPEKRVIKNIAMAHGGKTDSGSKDTISLLSPDEPVFGIHVKTRLLAAVLRFADELADDNTRANREALDLGILGTESVIFHKYSQSLHTVEILDDNERKDIKVSLVYELEASELINTYKYAGSDKYLIDEIYDRTIKMEMERRYCMKFMYPFVNIGRIEVYINIYGSNLSLLRNIKYTLEDVSYPETSHSIQIEDLVKKGIPTGVQLIKTLGIGENKDE